MPRSVHWQLLLLTSMRVLGVTSCVGPSNRVQDRDDTAVLSEGACGSRVLPRAWLAAFLGLGPRLSAIIFGSSSEWL